MGDVVDTKFARILFFSFLQVARVSFRGHLRGLLRINFVVRCFKQFGDQVILVDYVLCSSYSAIESHSSTVNQFHTFLPCDVLCFQGSELPPNCFRYKTPFLLFFFQFLQFSRIAELSSPMVAQQIHLTFL